MRKLKIVARIETTIKQYEPHDLRALYSLPSVYHFHWI